VNSFKDDTERYSEEYAARGTYIYPPPESMRIVTDIFAFCKDRVPRWNTISISGYHMREAGCTAVQEVAFTLADGIAYVEAAIRAGLDVDSFASRLAFFFCCHNTFIEEVAKFRAARRLWAKIMKRTIQSKKRMNPACSGFTPRRPAVRSPLSNPTTMW